MYNKEEQLKSSIVFAREYLKETKISKDQLKYLCEEAIRGGQPCLFGCVCVYVYV